MSADYKLASVSPSSGVAPCAPK